MDQAKAISPDEFRNISSRIPFREEFLLKDYYVTLILYLLRDVKGIYFKGGTALQKIFLGYSRLSEDVDYTITRDLNDVREEITGIIKNSGFFHKVTRDKDVTGFVRLVIHYKDFQGKEEVVFIDINKRAELSTKPETHRITHFYSGFIPDFSVNTLSKNEMIAEKMAATIGRNKPRDHFDLYQIIKKGIEIDLSQVKKKCELSGCEMDITRMFNNAKKLKNRWDEDLVPLMASEEVTFQQVMMTLSRYFKLKVEKDKKRKS